MKAVVVHQYGPPQSFAVEEIPSPAPGPQDVKIRVAAAGISFVDLLTAAGNYQIKPPLPFTPGSEIAGTVESVGAQVTGFKAGDRVCAASPLGAWAQAVCVPAQRVLAVPPSVPFPQAAVFNVPYSTALLALQHRGALAPGETLFVAGAAGSVGLAAIQVGKLLGAQVIAGASSAGKRAAALGAGADSVIDTSAPDWPKSLKAAGAGRGIDVILDPVGGPAAEALFKTLAWGGRYLVVGFASGTIPTIAANWALLKSAALIGVNVGPFELHEPEAAARNQAQLARWFQSGRLTPLIAGTFPLADFVHGAALAAHRETIGRVVLTME